MSRSSDHDESMASVPVLRQTPRVVHEPLDTVIRAFEQGDGATIQQHRKQITIWLHELRRRRERD